jgi:protein CpxP
MKKLMMVCGLALGVFTMANAQTENRKMITPEERAKKQTEKLAENLKLSDAQKAKVLNIYTAQAKEQSKQMVEAKKAHQQARQERMAQLAKNEKELQSVLTADQQKAYDTMKAERKAKMEKRRAEHQGKGHKGPRDGKREMKKM